MSNDPVTSPSTAQTAPPSTEPSGAPVGDGGAATQNPPTDPAAGVTEPTSAATAGGAEPPLTNPAGVTDPLQGGEPAGDPQGTGEPNIDGAGEDGAGGENPESTIDPAFLPNFDPAKYDLPESVPDDWRNFGAGLGLSQKQLEAAIVAHVDSINAIEMDRIESLKQAGQELLDEWGAEADHRLDIARRALNQVDKDGELKAILNETGYGNHPAVLKFMYNLGRQMLEGGFLRTEAQTKEQRSRAERLYPTMVNQ